MGSASIHEMLVNKSKKIILSYGRKDFRVGDKIVMTANNYNHGYINGDIGYVIGEGSNGSLEVDFMTKKLEISHSDLYDVDFADAVTIHKSQGSEYETVHIVLPKYAEFMISRRMLYTAITRAKKKVYIYSVQNTVDAAISNIHEYVRCTALLDRMDFSANLAT